MSFRMCFTAIFIFCFGCGGSSDTPPVETNSKKIANGFYLEQNNSNNALIVSDSTAIAYSRLEAIHGLTKVISIYSNSKTDAVHKDSALDTWIPVIGSFNDIQYQYQCKNTQDAGSTCINAIKKLNFRLDQSRTAQRPANSTLNETYKINDRVLEFNGTHEQFTLNFDNGSFLSRSFTSQVTSWGSYYLISDTQSDKAIVTFYTLANQSYFDLLIYTESESYKFVGIQI